MHVFFGWLCCTNVDCWWYRLQKLTRLQQRNWQAWLTEQIHLVHCRCRVTTWSHAELSCLKLKMSRVSVLIIFTSLLCVSLLFVISPMVMGEYIKFAVCVCLFGTCLLWNSCMDLSEILHRDGGLSQILHGSAVALIPCCLSQDYETWCGLFVGCCIAFVSRSLLMKWIHCWIVHSFCRQLHARNSVWRQWLITTQVCKTCHY